MKTPLPTITADAIVLNAVADELQAARNQHAPMMSPHHAYAVILEEVEEFWDEVRKKRADRSPENMLKELQQIAAMACRAAVDLGLVELPE